jgi:hypothetical protein
MTTPFLIYTFSWISACLLALCLAVINRQKIELLQPLYWRFLFQPWKLVIFLVAATGMTLIAPYTGDPTWDYIDTAFMSILTFCTAPWSIGTLYRSISGKSDSPNVYIACCLWMFSASWSYDLYLFFRDGYYPMTWLPNIFASSILYILAGMLWSLEWKQGKGVTFGFIEHDWPSGKKAQRQGVLLLFALPLIIMVMALIAPFLIDYFNL